MVNDALVLLPITIAANYGLYEQLTVTMYGCSTWSSSFQYIQVEFHSRRHTGFFNLKTQKMNYFKADGLIFRTCEWVKQDTVFIGMAEVKEDDKFFPANNLHLYTPISLMWNTEDSSSIFEDEPIEKEDYDWRTADDSEYFLGDKRLPRSTNGWRHNGDNPGERFLYGTGRKYPWEESIPLKNVLLTEFCNIPMNPDNNKVAHYCAHKIFSTQYRTHHKLSLITPEEENLLKGRLLERYGIKVPTSFGTEGGIPVEVSEGYKNPFV